MFSRRFFTLLLPATQRLSAEARRRDEFQAAFLLLGTLLAILMFLHRLSEDGWQGATLVTLATVLLMLLLLIALRRDADRRLVADSSILVVLITVIGVATQDHGLYSRVMIWLPAIPLIANFFPGRIRAAQACLLIIAMLFSLALLHQYQLLDSHPELGSVWARFGAFSASMVLISVTAWLYEQNRREADAEKERLAQLHRRWVAVVSHELRTPLTALRGALALARYQSSSNDSEPALLEIALRNCKRLIELVDDLLDMERINAGKLKLSLQHTDVQPLLTSVVATHSVSAQDKQLTLQIENNITEPAWFDAARIEQVLHNLLSNAIKFSPPAGQIWLRAYCKPDRLILEVCDQGPGISDELAGRLFTPFSQEEADDARRHGGFGLGLSISHAIVEAHSGQLGFRNLPAGGCCFMVELPHPQPPEDRSVT
ncbi:MAG: sensor histidine kinase [Pseudomonadota bacterium]